MTFRWYGEGNDPIPLKYIKQIPNCSGIMGVLDQYAAGEVWPEDAIEEYVKHVNAAGLEVEIIESVNVHEDIKLGLPSRDQYIENYKQTIRNLAKHGVKVIVYNFMPVFDWLRTDLAREIPEDGSNSLYYDEQELLGMTPQELVKQTAETSGFTLPGWEPERLADLDRVMKLYEEVSPEQLLANFKYFLEGIIPTCEEVGIKMAVHPDDPAWPIFGLPRIVHNKEQLEAIINLVDSPSNGLCFCTGSLGSNPDNDVPEMLRYFSEKDRVPAIVFGYDEEFNSDLNPPMFINSSPYVNLFYSEFSAQEHLNYLRDSIEELVMKYDDCHDVLDLLNRTSVSFIAKENLLKFVKENNISYILVSEENEKLELIYDYNEFEKENDIFQYEISDIDEDTIYSCITTYNPTPEINCLTLHFDRIIDEVVFLFPEGSESMLYNLMEIYDDPDMVTYPASIHELTEILLFTPGRSSSKFLIMNYNGPLISCGSSKFRKGD